MSYKTKICTTLHKIYDILCLTIRVADLDPDLKDPNHFAGAGSGSGSELFLRISDPEPDPK